MITFAVIMSAALSEQSGDSNEDFFGAVERLDIDRDTFFMNGARYADWPTKHRLNTLVTSSTQLASDFSDAVRLMTKPTSEESFDPLATAEQAISMLMHEDYARVKWLLDIAPGAPIKRTGEQDFEAGKESLLSALSTEDITTFHTMVLASFTHGLEVDGSAFVSFINETKRAKYIEVGKSALRHASDIGKVGVGVALGMAVLQKTRRG